jgi:hypothetical protein
MQDGLRRHEGHIARARQLFTDAVAAGIVLPNRPRLARLRVVAAVVAAVLALGAAAVVVVVRRPRALTFVVGPTAEPGRIGAWMAAPPGSELTLSFSDRTAVVLEPGARARVVSALDRSARLLIESGRVRVAARAEGGRWSFDAGPLTVETRGARLDLAWDPIDERFATTVFDGSAEVQGDCLAGARAIGPGEMLDISCRREIPPAP